MKNKHFCSQCNQEVTGNLRSPIKVSVKCNTCVQGEVEYINNHPQEFPEAHKSLSQINRELKRDAIRRRRARREASA